MARTRPGSVPAEVRRVREQFERWRVGKQGQDRIPPRLWEAAASLCGAHGIHQVSRWLRLNHTALQRRAGRRRTRSRQPEPSFVEWKLPAGVLPGVSSAEYIVEVGREDGAQRVHVRGANVAEVAALAWALRAEGSGN